MTTRKPPRECRHEDFAAQVAVNRIEDVGGFSADLTIKCVRCGIPFHFLGLPAGVLSEKPSVSADGTEARLPIAPGKALGLPTRLVFEMPQKGTLQ